MARNSLCQEEHDLRIGRGFDLRRAGASWCHLSLVTQGPSVSPDIDCCAAGAGLGVGGVGEVLKLPLRASRAGLQNNYRGLVESCLHMICI